MAYPTDYYSVLGVPPTADRETIHTAWKALLRRYHPDANRGVDVSARAKAINEAYAVLGKNEARADYDRSRPSTSSRPAATHRPVYAAQAGQRPMRHGPSSRPGGSFSQPPLDTNQWLIGVALLLLTAAPLAMIVVLGYEESGSSSTVRRDAPVHHGREPPARTDRTR